MKSESFLTLIDSKDPNTIKAQKHSKNIVKIIHGSTVNFMRKENKNNDFIQQFVSSASPYSAILESITYKQRMYADTLFTLWS